MSKKKKKSGSTKENGQGGAQETPAQKDEASEPEPSFSWREANIPAFVRGPWFVIFIIVLIGLYFRLSTTLWEPMIYPDSTQYLSLAGDFRDLSFFKPGYDINQGFIKSRHLPPLYSILLAIFSFIPADREFIGICISLIMSCLTFIPLYFICRRMHSRTAGYVAAILFAFHAYALRYAHPILTESTFSFLFMATIAVGLRAFDSKSPRLFAIVGIVAAFCYLTRDAGIASIAMLTGWAVIYYLWINRIPGPRIVFLVSVMILAFTAVCLPYLIHIRLRTGHFGLTVQMPNEKVTEQILLFGGDRWDRDKLPGKEKGTELLDQGQRLNVISILKNIPGLARKIVFNGSAYANEFISVLVGFGMDIRVTEKTAPMKKFFLAFFTVTLFFMLFSWLWAGLNFIYRRDAREFFHELYLFSFMLQIPLLYALVTPYMVDERYMYPLTMPSLIFAGLGIVRCGQWLVRETIPRLVKPERAAAMQRPALIVFCSLIIAVAFAQLYPAYKDIKFRMSDAALPTKYASGHKQMAGYLWEHHLVTPGLKIMDRKPFSAYYLKGQWVAIPKTYEEIDKMIKNKEADILVADSFTLHYLRPLLLELGFAIHEPQVGRIIYSKVWSQYRRVITVYDLRTTLQKPLGSVPDLNERLGRANEFFKQEYLFDASRECLSVLYYDRDNVTASMFMTKIYGYYFQATQDPIILPYTVKAYEKYLALNPGDKDSKDEYQYFQGTYNKLVEKVKKAKEKQAAEQNEPREKE